MLSISLHLLPVLALLPLSQTTHVLPRQVVTSPDPSPPSGPVPGSGMNPSPASDPDPSSISNPQLRSIVMSLGVNMRVLEAQIAAANALTGLVQGGMDPSDDDAAYVASRDNLIAAMEAGNRVRSNTQKMATADSGLDVQVVRGLAAWEEKQVLQYGMAKMNLTGEKEGVMQNLGTLTTGFQAGIERCRNMQNIVTGGGPSSPTPLEPMIT